MQINNYINPLQNEKTILQLYVPNDWQICLPQILKGHLVNKYIGHRQYMEHLIMKDQ